MGTHHGGARLDQGEEIDLWGACHGVRNISWIWMMGFDLWGHAMGARDWIGRWK